MSRFHVRLRAQLRRLASVGPFVAACLCRVKRRCGNPRCRCAAGRPHHAYLLTFKAKGQKSRSIHVPKALLPEVRRWVQQYKRVKKLVKEISYNSLQIVRLHVRTNRAAGRTSRPQGR
jgi:hypothetical protein